jgi:MFS transporter, DHA3 family, macrolide efflux protein
MQILALLRRKGPRLLWSGQLASLAGDRLYAVALIWVTLRLTGSPVAVSLVTLAATVPFLAASLISGAVADARDGLRLARAVDIARALIVAVVPVAYLTGHLDVLILALVACGLSALEAFCLPALQASLPRLVERDALTPLVSLLDSTDRLARVLGPGAIGLLVAVVPEVHLFSIDAASFVVSAVCLGGVLRHARPREADVRPGAQARFSLITAGWQVVWRHSVVRYAMALRAVCNVAWPAFTIGVPFLVADSFHRGIAAYGLVLGAFGAGNLAGNALASRIGESRLLRWCCMAWAASGAGFAAMALAPQYYLLVLACASVGVCTPLASVTIDAYIVRTLDHGVLARAYATQRFLVVAAGAAGLPAAALLMGQVGAAATLALAGGFMTAAAVAALCFQPRKAGSPGAKDAERDAKDAERDAKDLPHGAKNLAHGKCSRAGGT